MFFCYTKRLLSVVTICFCLAFFISCKKEQTCSFSLEKGKASITLTEFADQAGVEILFENNSIRGIETNAVEGAMTPLKAMELMLKGTTLTYCVDPVSHAFAISRNDDLNPDN
jgi:hypothetical protein